MIIRVTNNSQKIQFVNTNQPINKFCSKKLAKGYQKAHPNVTNPHTIPQNTPHFQ